MLSPDIRRPGRVGDLIIPILDPHGDDRSDFVRWVLEPVLAQPTDDDIAQIDKLTKGYSAASFATLRSNLKAADVNAMDQITELVHDQIPADIGDVRRYQTLQALMNCTRRSLMPDGKMESKDRKAWLESGLEKHTQPVVRSNGCDFRAAATNVGSLGQGCDFC